MASVLQKTAEITQKIEAAGFQIVEMWEHDFLSQKKSDPELCTFLKTHNVVDRLNPRDAFFGGRKNAVKLFYEGTVKYVDFTSLYPWVSTIFYFFSFVKKMIL